MPTTRRGDATIHYESRGAGPALLLIGGFGSDASFWAAQHTLAEQFRVLTFDHRGVGRSRAPLEPWTAQTLALDALAVLDAAGETTARVAGHSMGGVVAQVLALHHAERIEALWLLSTFARGPRSGRARTGLWPDVLESLGVEAYVDNVLAWCVAASRFEADPSFVEELRAASLDRLRARPLEPEALRAQRHVIAGHDVRARLAAVAVPTRVVVGAEDILTPPFWSEELAAGIPGARLAVVAGAGHLLPVERPEVVNRLLAESPHEV